MAKLELVRLVLGQIGHISLHYIDYPIDILLIIKHVRLAFTSTSIVLIVFFVLPNIILAILSALFNLRRLPLDHLIFLTFLLLLNLEPLAYSLIYIGMEWMRINGKTQRLAQKSVQLIEFEKNAASYNQLIATSFRSFFNNYLVSLILACNEYQEYLLHGHLRLRLESVKIIVSVCKLTIYSSRVMFYFLKNEFNLNGIHVLRFYSLRLTINLMFLIARSIFLVVLLSSDTEKSIFSSLIVFKFLLNAIYLVYFFNGKVKVNSLVLFWSIALAFLQQTAYVGDYFELFSNVIETFIYYAYIIYERKCSLFSILFYTVSTLSLLFSMCIDLIYFRALLASLSSAHTRHTFTQLFRNWIIQQSKPTANNENNENLSLVIAN